MSANKAYRNTDYFANSERLEDNTGAVDVSPSASTSAAPSKAVTQPQTTTTATPASQTGGSAVASGGPTNATVATAGGSGSGSGGSSMATAASKFGSFFSSVATKISSSIQETKNSFLREKENSTGQSALTAATIGGANAPAQPPWKGVFTEEHQEKELKKQILNLAQEPRSFLQPIPPEANFEFDIEKVMPSALAALEEDAELRRIRFILVPRRIREPRFWKSYFYRVSLIKAAMIEYYGVSQTASGGKVPNYSNHEEDSAAISARIARKMPATGEAGAGDDYEWVSEEPQHHQDHADIHSELNQLGVPATAAAAPSAQAPESSIAQSSPPVPAKAASAASGQTSATPARPLSASSDTAPKVASADTAKPAVASTPPVSRTDQVPTTKAAPSSAPAAKSASPATEAPVAVKPTASPAGKTEQAQPKGSVAPALTSKATPVAAAAPAVKAVAPGAKAAAVEDGWEAELQAELDGLEGAGAADGAAGQGEDADDKQEEILDSLRQELGLDD